MFIEWNQKITESASVDDEFKIKGVAINETTTSNNHRFIAEELETSANTLRGVPLLKDHNNSVDAIVGRVKEAGFDSNSKSILFEAKVNDPKIKELIKRGDLNTVSVGAQVDEIEEAEDGALIPRGITFKELSVVAVPADSGATFGVALMEAYKSNSTGSKPESKLIKLQEVNMPEEEKLPKEAEVQPEEESKPVEEPEKETEEEPKEEEEESEKAEESVDLLDEIKKLKEELASLKAKESDKDEKAEEPKPESKSEPEEEDEDEEEEEVEESTSYKFVEGFGSLKGGALTYVGN